MFSLFKKKLTEEEKVVETLVVEDPRPKGMAKIVEVDTVDLFPNPFIKDND